MIGFGALLSLVGGFLLMIGVAGLQPGIKGPAHEPYSTAPLTIVGGALLATGAFLLVRGLRARRRRIAERDAARAARRRAA